MACPTVCYSEIDGIVSITSTLNTENRNPNFCSSLICFVLLPALREQEALK